MFDYRHYIPILRWKRAEWVALREMYEADRIGLTPFIELIPKDFAPWSPRNITDVNKVLSQKATEIHENWGRAPFFVDLWLLQPGLHSVNGIHPLVVLGNEARIRQLSLIPVTGLRRNDDYQSAIASVVAMDWRGACIRVLLDDIQRTSFQNDLELRWRTFTIASGAFPKDLSELEKNTQHTMQRLDWLTWHGQVTKEAALPKQQPQRAVHKSRRAA